MKSPIFIAIFILASQLAFAQNEPLTGKTNQKGKLYVYWGWNRGWYTTSDISFRGTDYDFNLAGYGISISLGKKTKTASDLAGEVPLQE